MNNCFDCVNIWLCSFRASFYGLFVNVSNAEVPMSRFTSQINLLIWFVNLGIGIGIANGNGIAMSEETVQKFSLKQLCWSQRRLWKLICLEASFKNVCKGVHYTGKWKTLGVQFYWKINSLTSIFHIFCWDFQNNIFKKYL